jgi:hypothetical protein
MVQGVEFVGSYTYIVSDILDASSAKNLPGPSQQKTLLSVASAPHATNTREVLKVQFGAAFRGTFNSLLLENAEMLGVEDEFEPYMSAVENTNARNEAGRSLLHLSASRSGDWLPGKAPISVVIPLIVFLP